LGEIILGTLPFGSVLSDTDSRKLIDLAWENDIREFDVATLYGNGMAAEILATTLGERMNSSKVWVREGARSQAGVFGESTEANIALPKGIY
jgi:aryl-alcohol dehydrogenase-like predicted oxidoreductase